MDIPELSITGNELVWFVSVYVAAACQAKGPPENPRWDPGCELV